MSLKKKLNVLSLIAPFIAALASSAGATNMLVADRLAAGPGIGADERAEPEADAEQVEQRLEEARQEDQPAVLVDVQVPLDQPQRPAAPERERGHDPQRRHPRTSRRWMVRIVRKAPTVASVVR